MARIDLLLLANHKKTSYFVRWNEVIVDRWQLAYAMETLAQRWKWSRWKVNRFISVLQTKQQIVQQKSNVITVITIINYNKYQLDGTTDSTADSTADGQQTVQQTDIYKNVNNDKNINILNSNILSKDNNNSVAVEKKPITKEINFVISEIKNKMNSYWIVYSWEKERMFAKHILSKKWNKIASQYDFRDWLEFAKFIVDCSMQEWNWRQYKLCSIKTLYQKYAQIINSYQQAQKNKQSNVWSF